MHDIGMNWVDWMIVIIPFAFVYGVAIYSRTYIRGVSDFLSAGRVCRRYVLNAGYVATALSIIGIVSWIEQTYKTGFAVSFWGSLLGPIAIVLGLTGFFGYRWRETKAMSLGQFLEIRYSRKFRIFAAALRSVSEIIANSIMPAIAARFFIFLLDLPRYVEFCGIKISLFMLIMAVCLFFAISIICMGGTLALIITDSLQGMFLYPIMAVFVVYILVKFDWNVEIISVLQDRAPTQSFINPFDIGYLEDFNLFSLVLLPIFTRILHAGSWIGAGYDAAAKSPHEGKMGGLIGRFRECLNTMFGIMIAIMVISVFNHKHYADDALVIRQQLSRQIHEEPLMGLSDEMKAKLNTVVNNAKPIVHNIGEDAPLSNTDNIDVTYLDPIRKTLIEGDSTTADLDPIDREAAGNEKFQQYRTYYHQLQIASMMREFLPHGLMGLFFLLLLMAMVSTDDTRIYSASLTFTQDVIIPLLPKQPTMKQHITLLRLTSVGVGVVFLISSLYMAHLTYVNIFVTVVCSMWMGGCGPVMLFGLYSRFGTTAGAWTSLLTGMFLSFATFAVDRWWASDVYPWLQRHELVEPVGKVLKDISGPLPWVEWNMNPLRCPINGYEFYFMIMVITITLYVVVSYATLKEPFNLDRMLHRGKYNLDGENKGFEKLTFKNFFSRILCITNEYSKADKFITYACFIFSFGWQFLIIFLLTLIWNIITPWPIEWWSKYFYIVNVFVPGILAIIATFWFGIGGMIDLVAVFRSLEKRIVNHLDNGVVSGNVSQAEKAQMDALDAPAEEEEKK